MKVWNVFFVELMRSLNKKRYMKEGKLPKRPGQVLIHLQMSHVSMKKKKRHINLLGISLKCHAWAVSTSKSCSGSSSNTSVCWKNIFSPQIYQFVADTQYDRGYITCHFISLKQSALKKTLFIWQHKKVLGKFLSLKSENKQMVKYNSFNFEFQHFVLN